MIPYASRTVDIILHPDCPLPKRGAKDVINLLKTRELSGSIEAVVQISPERYRLTFHHARQMLAFSNQDFFVHGKPVEFKSVSPFTWVYISRLSYGIPDEAITTALAPYSGGIKSIKSVVHENIYTGEHNVLMKITANIPARLRIAGHWCVIKYKGQKPVCFKCHREGHVIAHCPTNNNSARSLPTEPVTNNDNNNNLQSSVVSATSRPPMSYAAAARNNLSQPPESTDGSSTPLTNRIDQPTLGCASGAPVSSAPSEGESTAELGDPTSPIRRRGKRRHSPFNSPQPDGKRATHDNLVETGMDAHLAHDHTDEEECDWSGVPTTRANCTEEESQPEDVPLPRDEDDSDDDDETAHDEDNTATDKDNATMDNPHNNDDDKDTQHNIDDDEHDNDEDTEDIDNTEDNRLDAHEDHTLLDCSYTSDEDDNASFATVSEAELPFSPVSVTTTDTLSSHKTPEDPPANVAHQAAALYKLAAVLPTQGGPSSS